MAYISINITVELFYLSRCVVLLYYVSNTYPPLAVFSHYKACHWDKINQNAGIQDANRKIQDARRKTQDAVCKMLRCKRKVARANRQGEQDKCNKGQRSIKERVTPHLGSVNKVLYYIALCCIALYCIVLYCTVLYCTVLYCTVLYYSILAQFYHIRSREREKYATVLHSKIMYYTAKSRFHRFSGRRTGKTKF